MTDKYLPALPERIALRQRLLAARERFARGSQALGAHKVFSGHLLRVLRELEPELLGVYWPIRGEFNAIQPLKEAVQTKFELALPYARRNPVEMHYRAWNGQPLATADEWDFPAPAQGPPVVPDVVLVPCLGYTRSGSRLGYGVGYFDRWLALHPHVTAIGVAWSIGEIGDAAFKPQAHDQGLTLVVTELGVVGGGL